MSTLLKSILLLTVILAGSTAVMAQELSATDVAGFLAAIKKVVEDRWMVQFNARDGTLIVTSIAELHGRMTGPQASPFADAYRPSLIFTCVPYVNPNEWRKLKESNQLRLLEIKRTADKQIKTSPVSILLLGYTPVSKRDWEVYVDYASLRSRLELWPSHYLGRQSYAVDYGFLVIPSDRKDPKADRIRTDVEAMCKVLTEYR
jgi:hypothetical protein